MSLSCPASSWAYDLAAERDKAMTWVDARRNGTDWVAVNETSSTGYTYDNALPIIAYTMAGDSLNAQDILGFLNVHQLGDGSWYDSMNQTNGAGVNTARSSGNQAWAMYAICFYADQTGDHTYLPMAERVATWLIARQDSSDGGITGGLDAAGAERTWTATEHNVEGYFAFKLLYHLTGNASYQNAMNNCKNWLLNVAWNSAEGRFNRGEGDPLKYLDPNTLGSLFLNDIQDYAKQDAAIAHIDATYYVMTTRTNGPVQTFYEGFKEKAVDDAEGAAKHWQEGTEQVSVTYLRKGRSFDGFYYITEVIKSDDPAFDIGHPDDDNDGDGGKLYYMTGTVADGLIEKPPAGLWQIFATNEYLGDRQKIFYPIDRGGGGGGPCLPKLTPNDPFGDSPSQRLHLRLCNDPIDTSFPSKR